MIEDVFRMRHAARVIAERLSLATSVRFEGVGIEPHSFADSIVEALLSAILLLIAIPLIAQGYLLLQPPDGWAKLLFSYYATAFQDLVWIASLGSVLLIFIRPFISQHLLSSRDFRVTKFLQDMPSIWIRVVLVTGMILIILTNLGLKTQSIVVSDSASLLRGTYDIVVGMILIYVPWLYASRFYSPAGMARVCLLRFLEDKDDSYLTEACERLAESFKRLGLRVNSHSLRAGINLGLLRGTITESSLTDLANGIAISVKPTSAKPVVDVIESILTEIEPKEKIQSKIPLRSKFTLDYLVKLIGVISAVVFLILNLVAPLLGILIPPDVMNWFKSLL